MRKGMMAGLLWLAAASAWATDVFDPKSNVLSIPSLQIGSTIYENARLLLNPSGQWNVLSLGSQRADATSSSTTTSATTTTTSALKVTPSTIEVMSGEDIRVVATGGTPPYKFSPSRSIIAQVSQTGSIAVFAVYGVGSVDITVSDAAGNVTTCTVKITSDLQMNQTSISGVVGEQLTVFFSNGVPPYTVGTSNSSIATAGEVTYHAPLQGSATIYTYRAGTATIVVHDAFGNLKSTALTVTNTR